MPNKNKKFRRLSRDIIEQYQKLGIFLKIKKSPPKEQDIQRMHDLALRLHKSHPQMSAENILQNQLDLYLTTQAELKKYYKSSQDENAQTQLAQAIKQKIQELTTNPLVDELFDMNYNNPSPQTIPAIDEQNRTIMSAILKSSMTDADTPLEQLKLSPEFLDSAEQLSSILSPQKTPNLSLQKTPNLSPQKTPISTSHLNKLPIFKEITDYEARWLEKLEKNILKKHPQTTAETLVATQIFALNNIREENKKLQQGHQDKPTTINNIKSKISEYTNNPPKQDLMAVENILYDQRRNFDTPLPSKNQDSQAYATLGMDWIKNLPPELEDVTQPLDGWLRSQSKEYEQYKADRPIYRFICNVDIYDKKLLTDINQFTIKYHCQNKISSSLNALNNRPDTLLIYAPIDNADYNTIASELYGIIKPYVRTNGDEKLDGDKLHDGLFVAKEKTQQDIKQLIQQAQTACPQVAEYLQTNILDANPQKKHPLSLGQFLCYQDLIKSVEIYEPMLQLPPSKTAVEQNSTPQPTNSILTVKESPVLTTNQNTSPQVNSAPSPINDNNFKDDWRKFAKKIAVNLKGTLNEDTDKPEFVAKIEHAAGEISIVAPSSNEVTLGAKDTSGNDTVPELKIFQELAQKALDDGQDINFGDIKTPEFKARLLIACMEKGVKMQNEPQLDEVFLASIEPKSKTYILALQNKQQTLHSGNTDHLNSKQEKATSDTLVEQPANSTPPRNDGKTPIPIPPIITR